MPILVEEIGIDAYHSIEPLAGMDIRALKRRYGSRISLWGNLDCGDLLTNGSPDQIVEEGKALLEDMAPGGGYLYSSSNAIHDAIPYENLQAMLHAVREYGNYT